MLQTGNADTATTAILTVTATPTETVYLTFVDGATGTQATETHSHHYLIILQLGF